MSPRQKSQAGLELLVIGLIGAGTFILSAIMDTRELITDSLSKYEFIELDEILVTTFVLSLLLSAFYGRRLRENQKLIEQIKERNKELEKAAEEIRRLQGFLPICSNCKKIREDSGYWHQVEVYIRDHSEAQFSHGICPECAKKLYPDFYPKDGIEND
jgi:hypothetical protein